MVPVQVWVNAINRSHVRVRVMYEDGECGQEDLDDGGGRRGVLGAAEVDDDPRDVAKKPYWDVGTDELQQRLHDAQLDAVVAEVRPVSCRE